MLPYLAQLYRNTVIDLNPFLANTMRDRFNFLHADTSFSRAFKRLKEVKQPVVVIATYHSTHVEVAEEALQANPNARIFMEKPPVTTKGQLERLLKLRQDGGLIEIGYNRRYTKHLRLAKTALDESDEPITITCIVKEKFLPLEHWYYWPTQGTRITGNLSHWIDLGIFLIREQPLDMNLLSSSERFPTDEAAISVHFEGGSQLNLIASDRGNELRGIQEFIDIRKGNVSVFIEDFLRLTIQKGGKKRVIKSLLRDKGHKNMYRSFLENCQNDSNFYYPNEDLMISSLMYLDIAEALGQNKKHIRYNSL